MPQPMKDTALPPLSRDLWIMTLGSLVVSQLFIAIGTDQSWLALMAGKDFVPDTLFVSTLSFVLWNLVRYTVARLQQKYDWFAQPLKRFLLQVFFGLLLPSVFCASCVVLYYRYYYGVSISQTSFPVYEFPLSVVLIAQFHLYYIVYFFYRKAKPQASPQQEKTEAPRKTLLGAIGRKSIPVEVADIAHFYIKDSVVYATTFDNKRLSLNYTLEEVYQLLDSNDFFRSNRQVIINRKACRSFLSEANGKLLVELNPKMEGDLIISQVRAPEFKKWIEAG